MSNVKSFCSYYQDLLAENSCRQPPVLREKQAIPEAMWVNDEVLRLETLLERERSVRSKGMEIIAGIDEVGRGPMAGPVVAAAVVFDKELFLPGLNDSKQVTEPLRELICQAIRSHALTCATGLATSEEIDKLNIHRATLLAMRRALEALNVTPAFLLVDGCHRITDIDNAQETVVSGDNLVYSIAAASIVAKVTRDKMMADYDLRYPGYNFSRHKGYCTKEHREALRRLGPCPIHRKSFAPVRSLCCDARQLSFI